MLLLGLWCCFRCLFQWGHFPFRVVPYQATTFPAGASTASWNVGHWDSAENGCEHFVTDGIDGIPIFVAHFGEIHWGGFHSHSVSAMFAYVSRVVHPATSQATQVEPVRRLEGDTMRYDEIRNSKKFGEKKSVQICKNRLQGLKPCSCWTLDTKFSSDSGTFVRLTSLTSQRSVRNLGWLPWSSMPLLSFTHVAQGRKKSKKRHKSSKERPKTLWIEDGRSSRSGEFIVE